MINSKLKILFKYLNSYGLHKESLDIIKLSLDKKIFMHIGGPSGSGKTTLMEKIQEIYPEVSCKDLDEFDEDASRSLNLPTGWKQNNYTEKLASEHFKEKQKLLENFVEKNKDSKIIFVGIHFEADFYLNFDAHYKILLNTSISESLKRKIRRDKKLNSQWTFWKSKDSIKSEINESKKIISILKSNNYIPMSEEQILNLLKENFEN